MVPGAAAFDSVVPASLRTNDAASTPSQTMAKTGTIRGDYSHMSFQHSNGHGIGLPNLIHASGDAEEAKLEIAHWFKPEELHVYEVTHEKFTQTTKK